MDKYDQLIDQLKRAKNTKNAEEIDRTIEVLNTFKTFLLQKFEAQCSKFQHHKFEKQYYNNHRISVTYTALELPQPFYPDGSPVKVLFIRNIRQKLNRERLTEFLDGHSVTQFSLSNIQFSRNESTTARIHCADLAVSCYIQTLSCLKKLEWSYIDQNGKKHSGSAVVHPDSQQKLADDLVDRSALFEEIELYREIVRLPELARIVLGFLDPISQVTLFIAAHRRNSDMDSFDKVDLHSSWALFTGTKALKELKLAITQFRPTSLTFSHPHEVDIVTYAVKHLVKEYTQEGQTTAKLENLGLSGIKTNITMVKKFSNLSLEIKKLKLRKIKGVVESEVKVEDLKTLIVSNTDFFTCRN